MRLGDIVTSQRLAEATLNRAPLGAYIVLPGEHTPCFLGSILNATNMRTFQAFQIADDRQKIFGRSSSIQEYYEAVIQAAFPAYVKTQARSSKSGADDFETALKAVWGSRTNLDACLIGYLPQDNWAAKDYSAVLHRIAAEEAKYYYQWLENGQPVEDDASQEILTQLCRASVLTYDRIFWGRVGGEAAQQKTLQNNIAGQDHAAVFLPIAISWAPYFTADQQAYFGVYVNPTARPLFLDMAEETQVYQYHQAVGATSYSRKYTFEYDDNHYKKLKNKADDQLAPYDYKNPDKRYLARLKDWINQELAPHGQATPIARQVYEAGVTEAWLLDNINQGPAETWQAQREEAKALALEYAQLLPANYHCFYYGDEAGLASFLSTVEVAAPHLTSMRYAMRADKVNEVNYRWYINLPSHSPDLLFARLLAYWMGLDSQYFLAEEERLGKAYFPTNWPYSKAFTKTPTSAADSWFHYYKAFKARAKRRNQPAKDPHRTRITNPPFLGGSASTVNVRNIVKLDNVSHRTAQKAISLGTATGRRLQAGRVMARALNKFRFYKNMLGKKYGTQVTPSSLPATSFARYLVSKDTEVAAQWRQDNAQHPDTVRTHQEWCHLWGHGDGGMEHLGNLVAGSKNCNTEQLAIEAGQRRVTHNNDVPQAVRNKITASITAYLMPNEGAWITGTVTRQQYEALLAGIQDKAAEESRDAFFDLSAKGGEIIYTLKPADGLRAAFDRLTQCIKSARGATKNALRKLKSHIEQGCFLYQPLARWIRYKVYYDQEKVFDHLFDGQSHSLNVHECQILEFTLERVLYQALSRHKVTLPVQKEDGTSEAVDAYEYYQHQIIQRTQRLVPTETEGRLLEEVLAMCREVGNLHPGRSDKWPEDGAKAFNMQADAWQNMHTAFRQLPPAVQQRSVLKGLLADLQCMLAL